jgi:hypothetical protein
MNAVRRLLILALVPVLISAAPAKQIIPLPDNDAGGEALIVPADSPVHFRGWNKYGYAQFDGRFVLTGTFMYGCGEGDCEGAGPYKESELTLAVVPDAELAARLPNWKIRHNDMMILISRWRPVEHSLATVAERRMLLSGKTAYISGRISIDVDHFETGIECDSANFGARFVAIAKPAKVAINDFTGDYGCAAV